MNLRLSLVELVVADMAASLAFYRRLGLDIPTDADQAHLCRDALAVGRGTPAVLRGERREEVDGVAVGVADDGISHSPEGIPRL